MNVTYKKDINHTYILFQGEHVPVDSFQVQMLLHNMVEGLLPCSRICLNDEEVWRCECTGLPSLDVYCRTKELEKEDFIWVVHQLLENIQEIQDYLLDVNHLYLLPEYIYIHPEKNRILCCLVPFYHNDVFSSLKQVLQFLLQYLNPKDEGAASMAYGLFRMLSREDCSMELLWAFLYEKEHSWKRREAIEVEIKETKKTVPDVYIEAVEPADKTEIGASKERIDVQEIQKEKNSTKERNSTKEGNSAKEEKLTKEGWAFLEELTDVNFWKKIAYVFPALAAVVLFLYLAFQSWTMSGRTLLIYAGMIVGFQIVSLILYWLWGRQEKEVNPLMEAYASEEIRWSDARLDEASLKERDLKDNFSEKPAGMSKTKTNKTGSSLKSLENWSEEFEKKLFGKRSCGFLDEDGCTVLLTQAPNQKLSLIRKETGQRYELKEGETLIGKSKDRAQILLTEDTVSRIHALIVKKQDMYYIQDLNSKNGTYLNGERITIRTNYPVKSGDEIIIADVRFCFV